MMNKTRITCYRSSNCINYIRSISNLETKSNFNSKTQSTSNSKPQKNFNKKEHADDTLKNAIEKYETKAFIDWKAIKEEVFKNSRSVTPQNIDALTVNFCASHKKYKIAESYLNYLKEENVKPNLATIGKYFKMYYLKYQDDLLKERDEKIILNLYHELRNTYKILDSITNEHVILGLSVTTAWKECIDLLNEIKVSTTPNTSAYSATVTAAFSNNENELAWKLLEEMIENYRTPLNDVYIAYLKQITSLKFAEQVAEQLEHLFRFFANHDIKCSEEVANKILDVCRLIGRSAAVTLIFDRNMCSHCKTKLNQVNLSEKEFEELKEVFFEKVIIGKNMFYKTTPAELDRFKEFTENMSNFDVIVDGLNVAYSSGTKQSPKILSMLLASVVRYFVQKNKKVLVLGRNHMSKWPKENWSYVTSNATTFLTEDLSQDDPYLLYCALNCGLNTTLVSRDLMRSHLYLLKDVHSRKLFRRWLTQIRCQLLYVDVQGRPHFKAPLPYMVTAQKNNNHWHIPCENSSHTNTSNVGECNWICLKL